MLVRYNSLNILEKPQFTLCNPGSEYNDGYLSKVVGNLIDHEAEEIVFNFNSISELNLRTYLVSYDNYTDNETAQRLFRATQNRRLIFVSDIGYFMITGIENGYEGNKKYKDIKAQSIDVEIQQKMVPYIPDGTYMFYNPHPLTNPIDGVDMGSNANNAAARINQDLLSLIVDSLPLWTIDYVDETVAARWRTFDDVDVNQNCLSFLLDSVQTAYECIFLFDIIHRTISVYDQNTYVNQTDIHIGVEDVINSINITENADDVYTAVRVMGDDNTTIAAVNPLGTNVVYNFDYYTDWMSPGLSQKVEAWRAEILTVQDHYYDINLEYYEKLGEANNLNMEISMLMIRLTMYQRCRENIVADSDTSSVPQYNKIIVENGGTPIEISDLIEETLASIDALIAGCQNDIDAANADLEDINEELTALHSEIAEIRESLSFDTFFTQEEYEELMHYIFEGSYQDEYVIITDIMTYPEKFEQMKTLYDRAMDMLIKASRPTQEFSIDSENFIFSKEFEKWNEQLETGCLINVEVEPDDVALLFLTNITINYDDRNLSFTFGNRLYKFDPRSLFEDVLGKINKSANSISYIKELLTPITSGEFNEMKAALQTSRDLTMGNVLASENEEVIIDGSGYTGRRLLENGAYDPHQVKLTGRNLVFTDDAWESCKVAVGELLFGDEESAYGINANAIIGDMIIGNRLNIVDSNGNDLFTVVDGKIASQVNDLNGRITAIEQNANELIIRVQTLESTEVDSVTTATGYTFNEQGLTIAKSGEEIRNMIDNTGMYVTRSGETVLSANNEGVEALNLTSRQYLIAGENSRFEDFSNGTDTHRTACYFIS